MSSEKTKSQVDSSDPSDILVDKEVSEWSEEELRYVLDQVTDHNKRESEKCALVRRLNEEAHKDEPFLESSIGVSSLPKGDTLLTRSASATSSEHNLGRKARDSHSKVYSFSGPREAEQRHQSVKPSKQGSVHSSHSLQDLATFGGDQSSMRAVGAQLGRNGPAAPPNSRKLNKATRANSFSLASASQSVQMDESAKASDSLGDLSERSASAAGKLSCGKGTNRSKGSRSKQVASCTAFSSSSPSFMGSSHEKPVSVSSSPSDPPFLNNSSSACDPDSGVFDPSLSSSSPSNFISNQETYSESSGCPREGGAACGPSGPPFAERRVNIPRQEVRLNLEDEGANEIELQDFRKKAEFVHYSSKGGINANDLPTEESSLLSHRQSSYKTVDSFVQFSDLKSGGPVDTQYAERVLNHPHDGDHSDSLSMSEDCKSIVDNSYERNKYKPCRVSGNENRIQSSSSATASYSPDANDMNYISAIPISSPNALYSQNRATLYPSSQASRAELKKKKKAEATKQLLAEQIEGHIGYKDVDFLTSWVSGGDNGNQQQPANLNMATSKLNGPSLLSDKNGGIASRENGMKRKDKVVSCSSLSSACSSKESIKRRSGLNGSSNGSGSESEQRCCSSQPLLGRNIPSSYSFSSNCNESLDMEETPSNNTRDTAQDDPDSRRKQLTEASPMNSSGNCRQSFQPQAGNRVRDMGREQSERRHSATPPPHPNPSASSFHLPDGALLSDDEREMREYAASDSEMPDQELVFRFPKTKRRRFRCTKLRSSFQQSSNPSAASSSSTTPSLVSSASASVIAAAATARGYESEREYCVEEFRKSRPVSLRRKSASSMPHSEQNSADNSDVDSSLSLPAVRRVGPLPETSDANPSSMSSTPKISYADIAKLSVFSPPSSVQAKHVTSTPSGSGSTPTSQKQLHASHPTDQLNSPLIPDSKVDSNEVQSEDFPKLSPILSDQAFVESPISSKTIEALTCPLTVTQPAINFSSPHPSPTLPLSFADMPHVKSVPSGESSHPQTASAPSRAYSPSAAPPTMRKSNSVPESNPRSSGRSDMTAANSSGNNGWKEQHSTSSLPPVIMYDYTDSPDDIGSSVTFGFFEDMVTVGDCYQPPQAGAPSQEPDASCQGISEKDVAPLDREDKLEKVESQTKASPQNEFPRRFNLSSKVFSVDVDTKSFNYIQIITYFKKAWEKVLHEYENNVASERHRNSLNFESPVDSPSHRQISYYRMSP